MAGPWEAYQSKAEPESGPWSAYQKKAAPPPVEQIDPTEGMSGPAKFLAGMGKAAVDIGRAVKQMTGNASQQEIDDAKALDAPLMKTGAGITGNLAGNLLASMLPAGAAGVAVRGAAAVPALAGAVGAAKGAAAAHPMLSAVLSGAGSGALMGALEPTSTGESRASNMAKNAAIGGAASGAMRGLARVVRPETADDASKLIDEGVRLTPGQALGGAWKASEEKLASLPLLGDIIKGAQRRGVEDFNRAAFNRALAPIGEKVGRDFKPGRDAVEAVGRKIGDAYDDVLARIGRVDLDSTFSGEVNKISSMTDELGDAAQKQFMSILKNRVVDRMTPAGTMSADTMKIVESDLGRLARQYKGSPDPNQRGLGAAINEVQASLRRAVERSAPAGAADDLAKANRAWAEFVRVEDAASRIGAKEGVFSPAQMLSAVRSQDKSVRKGAFARGNALGQDLAESGKSVLTQEVPDSGTAGRLLAAAAAGGGPIGLIDPTIATLTALGMLPYTALGGRATLAMLTKRPEGAAQLAQILKAGAPAAGVAGSALGLTALAGP